MSATLRFVLTLALLASTARPQSVRFRDEVFPQVDVFRDVAYGSAFNPFTNQTETLLLDLYQPTGDLWFQRPAVIVVHGGGFVAGNKAMPDVVAMAERFARSGYVAVSINYRLATVPNQLPTGVSGYDVGSDFKAAVRYLRSVANQWAIDPDRIAAIGTSAGAIVALQGAYLEGEGASGNPGFSSEIDAVVSLWGLMPDPSQLEAGEAPVCVIHGTDDPIVPYAGGVAVYQQALAVGVPCELHPIQGAGHSPLPQFFADHFDDVMAFYWEHLQLGIAGLNLLPGSAAPGTAVLETTGVAGDRRWLGVALGSTVTPVPGLGHLCLDPSSLAILEMPALPTAPRLPTVSTTFSVPAQAQGLTFWLQELHADANGAPRVLTNCLTFTF